MGSRLYHPTWPQSKQEVDLVCSHSITKLGSHFHFSHLETIGFKALWTKAVDLINFS
jgi:hypothetical protein